MTPATGCVQQWTNYSISCKEDDGADSEAAAGKIKCADALNLLYLHATVTFAHRDFKCIIDKMAQRVQYSEIKLECFTGNCLSSSCS